MACFCRVLEMYLLSICLIYLSICLSICTYIYTQYVCVCASMCFCTCYCVCVFVRACVCALTATLRQSQSCRHHHTHYRYCFLHHHYYICLFVHQHFINTILVIHHCYFWPLLVTYVITTNICLAHYNSYYNPCNQIMSIVSMINDWSLSSILLSSLSRWSPLEREQQFALNISPSKNTWRWTRFCIVWTVFTFFFFVSGILLYIFATFLCVAFLSILCVFRDVFLLIYNLMILEKIWESGH